MLKNIFNKKQYSDKLFLEELVKHDFNEEILQDMLNSGKIDINIQDKKGNSLLHMCIKKSLFKSALWLLKHKAKVKLLNNNKQSILDLAIEKNNHELVKRILYLDEIEINEKDEFGRTLLQNTVVLGYNEVAQILVEHGADINSKDLRNRNVIFDALSYGNDTFINYLLEHKHLELNNVDTNSDSIMHHPQVIKDDERAKKLIQNGADPTIKDKDGETFLCNTALRGMEAYHIIDTALQEGVDINSRVANNNTILMELVAASSKLSEDEKSRRDSLIEVSKNILLNGVDINAIDDNQESALFRAVRMSDFELVAFLLSNDVDPNIPNKDLETVLSLVIYQGIKSIDILLLLLRYKADPTIKNSKDQTMYEVLNDIILHTHGKKPMHDKYILSKIVQDGQYILILKELLANNKKDLNFLDSVGDPLFFKPLFYDHFHLFKLYIKYGLDIHAKNIVNHNIFFAYVLRVFEDDKVDIDFQNNISMLISSKLDHNYQDETGWTVVNKILSTNCNVHLFDILTDVVLFDYNITDKQGRGVMHTAVWNDKRAIMKRLHYIDPNCVNIVDGYGILPITYAALLGSQELVLLFIDLKANVKSGVNIAPNALKKFSPFLKNLDSLRDGISDEDTLRKMDMVIDQVKRDFNLSTPNQIL